MWSTFREDGPPIPTYMGYASQDQIRKEEMFGMSPLLPPAPSDPFLPIPSLFPNGQSLRTGELGRVSSPWTKQEEVAKTRIDTWVGHSAGSSWLGSGSVGWAVSVVGVVGRGGGGDEPCTALILGSPASLSTLGHSLLASCLCQLGAAARTVMALRVAAFDLDGVLALPSIAGALRRAEEALALPR